MTEYFLRLNWVDIIILILLLRTTYTGFTRGLGYEVLNLIGLIATVVIAIHNYKYLGTFFVNRLDLPVEFSNFIGFLILAFGTVLVFRYIRNIFYRYLKVGIFPILERFGGLIFGFIRGCLLVSIVLLCLLLIPNSYIRGSIYHKSLGGMLFLKAAPTCYEYSTRLFPKYRDIKKTRIAEEIMQHEPRKKKVKSHLKRSLDEADW